MIAAVVLLTRKSYSAYNMGVVVVCGIYRGEKLYLIKQNSAFRAKLGESSYFAGNFGILEIKHNEMKGAGWPPCSGHWSLATGLARAADGRVTGFH